MRKIREERERANSKTLEIKKLKKKEYEASQLAKKLEQSNQLQVKTYIKININTKLNK